MKQLLKKSYACLLMGFLFTAFAIFTPIVSGCSASANCDGGAVAWCQTFGSCDEASCVGFDGIGVACMCDEAAQVHECPMM